MDDLRLRLCLLFLALSLFGCQKASLNVPVYTAQAVTSNKDHYTVRKGDTLYSVAWRYDLDYRALARANDLAEPYHLEPGQVLQIKAEISPPKTHTKKIVKGRNKHPKKVSKLKNPRRQGVATHYHPVKHWRWPTQGVVLKRFSPAKGSKGLDIGGKAGTVVRAAAPGRVAYSGRGIRGYGNLLIIKHNDNYLSAYAHNRRLIVKEDSIKLTAPK